MTPAEVEAAYYQGVEEFFVSRRGDPMMLSNADWLLVRRWRRQGLPLRVVLRGVADALDAHAHSWGRRRKVASLRYCEAEVERARERWERATAEPGVPGLADTLRLLDAALSKASGLGMKGAAAARRAQSDLHGQPETARPRDLEPLLQKAETRLLEAIRSDDPEAARGAEISIEAALERYAERLPSPVFAALREQAIRRELLARHGLPRLSLFES